MEQKIIALIPVIIIAFTILSHALTFAAQVFADIHKDEPGAIKTVTDIVAKILGFLNGVQAPKA